MSEIINVNGIVTSADRAVVPVLDHGFLYGDGVYETLRTYGGKPFLLGRHLRRLEGSCRKVRIEPPPAAEVEREVRRTLAGADHGESYVRIMVTRGVGPIGYEPHLCPRPSLVVIVLPLRPVPARNYEEGVAIVVGRRRRNPIDSLDPAAKSCNLLNNLLAHMEAQDAGAHETILLNTKGHVAEGSHTNVFFVKGGTVRTPALSCGLLEGITRQVVGETAREAGIPFEEGEYTPADLAAADELFVTSTLQEIVPVTRLDGRPVGNGRPGPVTLRLLDRFRASTRRREGEGA